MIRTYKQNGLFNSEQSTDKCWSQIILVRCRVFPFGNHVNPYRKFAYKNDPSVFTQNLEPG